MPPQCKHSKQSNGNGIHLSSRPIEASLGPSWGHYGGHSGPGPTFKKIDLASSWGRLGAMLGLRGASLAHVPNLAKNDAKNGAKNDAKNGAKNGAKNDAKNAAKNAAKNGAKIMLKKKRQTAREWCAP